MAPFVVKDASDPEIYPITDGIVRSDRRLSLEEASKLADAHPIWADRGKAIHSYAQLEQSLCRLLALLGGMEQPVASTIFFKISSYDARNRIIEKLLHKKHGSAFNLFWNAYFKELRTIDLKRNEIVHWMTAQHVELDARGMIVVGVTLIPPNFWDLDLATGPRVTCKDLGAFLMKCDVFSRLCNMFTLVTGDHGVSPETTQPWLKIFRQPLVYPLPEDHPLLQKRDKPDSQPPASAE